MMVPSLDVHVDTLVEVAELITGKGFTVILYVTALPVQPFKVGVIVMVAVIAAFVPFVAVKPGTFPVPGFPKPIAVLSFVQAYVAPDGVLVKFVAGTATPAQTVMSDGAVVVGTGFTVMV